VIARTSALVGVALLTALLLSGCPQTAPQQAQTPAPSVAVNAPGSAANIAPEEAPAESAATSASAPDGDDTAPQSGPVQIQDWADYRGAWFDVKYPASFEPIPCERSTSADGYDGVAFASPDGKVEFYVFSPQWNGESDWIIQADEETVVDKSQETSGSRTATWVTLSGPGGKYERSYVDTVDSSQNTRLVFGFRYPDKATYQRWRPTYLKFKESLKQYAD
jgi:hypothetical protein